MTVNNQILQSLAGKQVDNVYSKDKYVSLSIVIQADSD
tara:strand:- start:2979 stop:3092 length:114 start_codon:yes stop_codon:yes gene_type:complete